jgi:hypothetical protein
VAPHSSAGTPAGISHGYDCAARKHAWEFGKATLPRHGSFGPLYDALQLQHCSDIVDLVGGRGPEEEDSFKPPNFATPSSSHVIFVDASVAAGGSGDGTRARPFATLESGVAAAGASGAKRVTLVLRAGRYHTAGVTLTSAHSGLTIQNYQGEEAIVSGTVPVPASKSGWSVHNAETNTWKLDLSAVRDMPAEAFGLRVGTARATLARYPNGDAEIGGEHDPRNGLSAENLAGFPRAHDPVNIAMGGKSHSHAALYNLYG